MALLTPEEIIQREVCPDKPLPKVRTDFHFACKVLNTYKDHIQEEYDKNLNMILGKVNMLLSACLKKDQAKIDSWLADFSQIHKDDTIGVNVNKIIDNESKRSNQ